MTQKTVLGAFVPNPQGKVARPAGESWTLDKGRADVAIRVIIVAWGGGLPRRMKETNGSK
jgi:hypothetical protein